MTRPLITILLLGTSVSLIAPPPGPLLPLRGAVQEFIVPGLELPVFAPGSPGAMPEDARRRLSAAERFETVHEDDGNMLPRPRPAPRREGDGR